jgi:hypothetical protein
MGFCHDENELPNPQRLTYLTLRVPSASGCTRSNVGKFGGFRRRILGGGLLALAFLSAPSAAAGERATPPVTVARWGDVCMDDARCAGRIGRTRSFLTRFAPAVGSLLHTGSPRRRVYCFGSPTYGDGDGFLGDDTSGGWVRQYGQSPALRPEMVTYDDRVHVMTSLGCHTIRARLRPNDPTTDGGSVQRAQLISSDTLQLKRGRGRSFGVVRGQTWYYGFAFATNRGYKPQNSRKWPNWNMIFDWHWTEGAPTCGMVLIDVSTQRATRGSPKRFADRRPRLSLDICGTSSARPAIAQQWHFYDPRPFRPGHRYRIYEKIRWGDSNTGAIAWWVDDAQVTPWTTGVSTMAAGYGEFPVFENYRPANARIGNLITWTNDVYYGGLVKGASLSDVAIP